MNWWTIVIYVAAAIFALQGLMSLLTVHRKASIHRFFEEELQRREEEAQRLRDAPSVAAPEPAARRTKAA